MAPARAGEEDRSGREEEVYVCVAGEYILFANSPSRCTVRPEQSTARSPSPAQQRLGIALQHEVAGDRRSRGDDDAHAKEREGSPTALTLGGLCPAPGAGAPAPAPARFPRRGCRRRRRRRRSRRSPLQRNEGNNEGNQSMRAAHTQTNEWAHPRPLRGEGADGMTYINDHLTRQLVYTPVRGLAFPTAVQGVLASRAALHLREGQLLPAVLAVRKLH